MATAVVAVALDPVQIMLERAASRLAHGDTPAPYDVWEQLSSTMTGTYPADGLPERMARVLAEGLGARWAQGWLWSATGPRSRRPGPPAAGAPVLEKAPGRRALPARHGG